MRWVPATMIFCVLLTFRLAEANSVKEWVWFETCSPMIAAAIYFWTIDAVTWVSARFKRNRPVMYTGSNEPLV